MSSAATVRTAPPLAMTAVGVFLVFGACMSGLAGTTLVWRWRAVCCSTCCAQRSEPRFSSQRIWNAAVLQDNSPHFNRTKPTSSQSAAARDSLLMPTEPRLENFLLGQFGIKDPKVCYLH